MAAKPPDAGKLYEAALTHLSRFGATQASLARVLGRRIDRWARLDEKALAGEPEAVAEAVRQAKAQIQGVIAKLVAEGVLSDAAFAASRARRLTRGGKSQQASLAHLAAKGVGREDGLAALPEDTERELAAAAVFLRRRKAGPFGEADELKILAAMARGGFSQQVARRALRLERQEAEALIKTL